MMFTFIFNWTQKVIKHERYAPLSYYYLENAPQVGGGDLQKEELNELEGGGKRQNTKKY